MAAVEDAAEQAGADIKALREYDRPAPSDETVELDCDIAIAGAGGSGMACAVAAAQEGKRVVLLEKTSNIGGNALVSGGLVEYIYAPDEMRLVMTDGYRAYFDELVQTARDGGAAPEFLDALQADYDAWYADGHTTVYDSTGLYTIELDVVEGGGEDFSNLAADTPVNDPDYAACQLDDWLNSLGIVWTPKLASIGGYPWPHWAGVKGARNGQGYFDLYNKTIADQSLPVQVVTLTPASEVIVEDGRATGLKGVSDDGTTYLVHASEAVVLATGGYSGNPDMLKKYNQMWDWSDDTVIPTTNAYGHTGDGIEMGIACGGVAAGMDSPMLLPFADARNMSVETLIGNTGSALLVNIEGRRFVDEASSRYAITEALLKQPESKMWLICDSLNSRFEDGKNQLGLDVSTLIETGSVIEADSLEELAEKMGIDPDVLADTVSRYNELAAGAEDTEFGRTAFMEGSQITTAPFYASLRTWAAHITIGGLVVDDSSHVLTEGGEQVPGLYAVGETAVGQCGLSVMGVGLKLARALGE